MRSLRLPVLPILVLLVSGLAGCKQGLGERCELDSDCESGLLCSTGSARTCENPALSVPDASTDLRDAPVIPDARFIPDGGGLGSVPDAPPIVDAPEPVVDAPPAPVDAPTIDAAPTP
jgi:hypothetical protein